MLAQGVAALTCRRKHTWQQGACAAVQRSHDPLHWFLGNVVLPCQTSQGSYRKWLSEIQSTWAYSWYVSIPDCLWMAWSACVLVNLPCWTGLGFRMLSTDRTGTELNSPIWEEKELHPWTVCSGRLDCIKWGHSLPTWASWGPCEQVLVWSRPDAKGNVCSAQPHAV